MDDFARRAAASRASTPVCCFEAGAARGRRRGRRRAPQGGGHDPRHRDGRTAHFGSAPDRGRNALLALAMRRPCSSRPPRARRPVAPDRRSRPILRSGDALQRRPRLRRAASRRARRRPGRRSRTSSPTSPPSTRACGSRPSSIRRWPGMRSEDSDRPGCSRAPRRSSARPTSRRAAAARPTRATSRPRSCCTVDGLGRARRQGPQPGASSSWRRSLHSRAEVALALILAALRTWTVLTSKFARSLRAPARAQQHQQVALRCAGRPGRRRRPS